MTIEHELRCGAIGNGRVIALVAPTTAIEWLCMPRFDSPSVFASLLDREDGGTFEFRTHRDEALEGTLEYVPNTNVLRTRVEDADWAVDIFDFSPRVVDGLRTHTPCEVVRLVVPVRGQARLRCCFDPRPDYGRMRPELIESATGIEVAGTRLTLFSNVPSAYLISRREFIIDRPRYFVLRYGNHSEFPSAGWARHTLDLTIAGWRAWARTCALPAFHPAEVLRSALCLKLHVYEETGAIIAAATTSIPEALGTERTWDYRYCWLRDSAFVVEGLRRLSHLSEGERFITFLRDLAEAGPLQPVYGIGGERELDETTLPHLRGFRGSGPVRIGNAAYAQRQNDLMGELLLCLDTLVGDERVILERPQDLFPLVERLVGEAIVAAPQHDTGIWEYRSALRVHTFSRAMCWAAIERGSRLAARLGHETVAREWASIAAREREEILLRGFVPSLDMFTQALDGEWADASNLLLPSIGLLSAKDARFRSTLVAYERLLVDGGLMLRYRHLDDLGQTTSAFTLCSFWWAEALALAGRLDDAVRAFEHVLAFANRLGLFSEDIDPKTGMLLGNFPQAYTHVGLVNAAMTIGSLIEARDGKVHAWI